MKKKRGLKKPIPTKPEDFDDESENEEDSRFLTMISLGDITISSKRGFKESHRQIKKLLEDKTIRNYLKFQDKKRTLTSLSYIG